MRRAWFAMAFVITLLTAPLLFAQAAAQPAPTTPARPRFVTPVKGVAEVGMLKAVVKYEDAKGPDGKPQRLVVSTIRIKNLSTGAIAGLRVDDFWYDKAGQLLPGDSVRLRQPLLPGEATTITLKTPRNPKMDRNSYQFSHANGQVKIKQLTKID